MTKKIAKMTLKCSQSDANSLIALTGKNAIMHDSNASDPFKAEMIMLPAKYP
jgi:hypothetical protein